MGLIPSQTYLEILFNNGFRKSINITISWVIRTLHTVSRLSFASEVIIVKSIFKLDSLETHNSSWKIRSKNSESLKHRKLNLPVWTSLFYPLTLTLIPFCFSQTFSLFPLLLPNFTKPFFLPFQSFSLHTDHSHTSMNLNSDHMVLPQHSNRYPSKHTFKLLYRRFIPLWKSFRNWP
jgi:hypothetical protein